MRIGVLNRLFFVAIFFVAGFASKAQEDVIHSVEAAMKLGSSKELARYLNQTVEINLEGEISSYSKMQAEFVIRDFFKKNPPDDFKIIHNGTSKGGLKYAIGKYSCKRGSFRVWMRVKEFGGKLLVYETNFFKEE